MPAAFPLAKLAAIPVQTLQVQQALAHRPVSRLDSSFIMPLLSQGLDSRSISFSSPTSAPVAGGWGGQFFGIGADASPRAGSELLQTTDLPGVRPDDPRPVPAHL